MSPPVVQEVSQEIYNGLGPWREDDPGTNYQLALYVDAHGSQLQPLEDLVRTSDDGPGFSLLLDVVRCPDEYLDHLAQYNGTVIQQQWTGSEKRTAIEAALGWERGRPATISAAAGFYLTGTKKVRLIERDGGAYFVTVITYLGETPDAVAVEAAVRAQKPGGLVLTYRCQAGPAIDELTGTINGLTGTINDFALAVP